MLKLIIYCFFFCNILISKVVESIRSPFIFDSYSNRYGPFSASQLESAREQTREMFYFAYDNYMQYAFPLDELDPINCQGRGHDFKNPSNININDVLGEYSLGLVDALDTLVVLQNKSEFHHAVRLVIDTVSFEKNVTVQVFEATIRIIGSFLSAHLILTDPSALLGDYRMPGYKNELLEMANDLASRLLVAFEKTATGLPYPRVNLMYGVLPGTINETCTAGAGSLLLEFGVLSRLLGDPTYESVARRVNSKLWSLRDPDTGLLGNLVDIQTGEWRGMLSGLGAGLDSFFEYALKAYILFGDMNDFRVFNESYSQLLMHNRRGRNECRDGVGEPPLFVNVHMKDGSTVNTWIDALQASHAGVLILGGQVNEAICQHALYYSIWRRFDVLPERFNWHLKTPDVHFYPLRPEFAESTYLLYLSTKNPFYLHVGQEIINSLNRYTRVVCGFATVHNVLDKTLEDRMESFFLSETCKYLYLLFDADNPVNRHYDRLIFTTEGHILPIDRRIRDADFAYPPVRTSTTTTSSSSPPFSFNGSSCEQVERSKRLEPPLSEAHLRQLLYLTGVCNDCF